MQGVQEQQEAHLQVGAVEEDGDEGVGGAAVGDHLLGEEHRIYLGVNI